MRLNRSLAFASCFSLLLFCGILPARGDYSPNMSLSEALITFVPEDEDDVWIGNAVGSGDVDGDGLSDILIAAPGYDGGGDNRGRIYLYLGKNWFHWGRGTSMAHADATFTGENSEDELLAVATGDVDGDGCDDIVMGARYNDYGGSEAGKVYVVMGGPGIGGDYYLSQIGTSFDGASFVGEHAGDHAGVSVACGDVNGDSRDDILIGAPCNNDGGRNAGKTYLIAGRPQIGVYSYYVNLDLSHADASFLGELGDDLAGYSVSCGGNADGDPDGCDDILIGAPGNDQSGNNAGKVYLVLGSASIVTDGDYDGMSLSDADASFLGEHALDSVAYSYSPGISSVAMGGNVDGDADGCDDIIIGAPGNDQNGNKAGKVYLVLGNPYIGSNPFYDDMDLGSSSASFLGEDSSDSAGFAVSPAGDTDGDGHDDILIGAFFNYDGATEAGKTYLILGKDGIQSDSDYDDMDLSLADASFIGERDWDMTGYSVSSAGDVDGNGLDDILIGAKDDDPGLNGADYYLLLSYYDTLYVDDNGPNDAYPWNPNGSDPDENGTACHPFDTIQEAVNAAGQGTEICVAGGIYDENIVVYKKIALRGGWERIDCDWSLPAQRPMTLVRAADPNLPVITIGGDWLGEETVVEGLVCRGGIPLFVYQASPVVRLCGFFKGGSNFGGAAVMAESAGRLENCLLFPDYDGPHLHTCGVFCSGGTPTIDGCLVWPGANASKYDASVGLDSLDSSPVVKNNVFFGTFERGEHYGIRIDGRSALGYPLFVNNTIHIDGANINEGILLSGQCDARIFNNIIAGDYSANPQKWYFGVVEADADGDPGDLYNNDFFDLSCLYRDYDYYGSLTDVADVNLYIGPDNIADDPMLSGDSVHLQVGSPCIDVGFDVSLQAFGGVTEDIDGHARPLDGDGDGVAAYDIGADEYPGEEPEPSVVQRPVERELCAAGGEGPSAEKDEGLRRAMEQINRSLSTGGRHEIFRRISF